MSTLPLKVDERAPAPSPMQSRRLGADMDNFPAGQANDANHDRGTMLRIADPSDLLHADDNLGDEAPFPTTWQHLACGDAPND